MCRNSLQATSKNSCHIKGGIPVELTICRFAAVALREDTQKDFLGVLEKVAQQGYAGVEFAG